MRINTRLVLFTVFLVAITVGCKILFGDNLDMSGFSPVLAIAVFSGMIIRRKDFSFLLPLLALLASDAVIEILNSQGLFKYAGFYDGQWVNYLLLLATTVIGWAIKGRRPVSLLAGAFAAPTFYFLVSNSIVWLFVKEANYTKDFSGWMTCLTAGLPFYKNSLIGTALFLPVIILTYNGLVQRKWKLVLG